MINAISWIEIKMTLTRIKRNRALGPHYIPRDAWCCWWHWYWLVNWIVWWWKVFGSLRLYYLWQFYRGKLDNFLKDFDFNLVWYINIRNQNMSLMGRTSVFDVGGSKSCQEAENRAGWNFLCCKFDTFHWFVFCVSV